MRTLVAFLFLICLAFSFQCDGGKRHFQIYRHYTTEAEEEYMEVYEGTSAEGTLVFFTNGIDRNNQLVIYDLCLNPTLHTFVAVDKGNNGWSQRSYFELCTVNGVQVLQGTLSSYSSRSWIFQAHVPVVYSAEWWYTDSNQDGKDWTSTNFDRSSWEIGSRGKFPVFSSITRYYCTTSDLYENITTYASLDLGIYSKAGFNIYVNGHKYMSRYLPEEDVTFETQPLMVDEEYALRRRGTYVLDELKEATQFTLCIENHVGTTLVSTEDQFRAYGLLLYGPRVDRVHEGTVSSDHYHDDPAQSADNAFDFSIYTQWRANSLPATIEYTFNNERNEWINAYAIWNGHNSSAYNPISWKVWGSHSQSIYYLIDAQSDITFDSFSSPKYFYLNCNTYHFNSIKFEFTSSRSGILEIGEIRFYTTNKPIHPPQLAYPQEDYTFIVDMDRVHIAPVNAGFTEFTIAGDLPSGLSMDPETGIISGTPELVSVKTIFTISAIYHATSKQYATEITITTNACTLPNKRFDLLKVNSKWSNGIEEVVNLYDPQNKLIDTHIGISYPMTEYFYQYFRYCLPQGVYRAELTTTDIYGWGHGSRVSVLAYDNDGSRYVIARRGLLKMTHDEFYFNTEFENHVTFRALYTAPFNDENWYIYNYDDTKTFTDYQYESMPQSQSNVWFFRQVYNITHSDHVQGYEFRFRARAGAVVYLDSKEIYRVNVEPGVPINSNTYATGGSPQTANATWYVTTGPRSSLPDGFHLFAVALVGTRDSTYVPVDYESTLRLLTETTSVSRTWDITGTQSSSVSGTETNANRLFDQNYYNRFVAYMNNYYPPPQWAVGTFNNNRREFINSYCITNGYESEASDPITWSLLGSNDNEHWTELDKEENVHWSRRSQRQCYYMYNQKETYNQIKLNIQQTYKSYPENDRVTVGELQFYMFDYDQLNIPELTYTPSVIEDYINTPISTILPSSDYYTNFSTVPKLANGLFIDSGTGIIYGTPTMVLDMQYTIYAEGPKGQVHTTIDMKIIACELPRVHFYIDFNDLTEDNAKDQFVLTNENGQIVDQYTSFPVSSPDIRISYCEMGSLFSLTVSDTDGKGWGTASFTVYLSDMTELANGNVLRGELKRTVEFNTEFIIYPQITLWSYQANGLTPSPLWTTPGYDTTNWQQAHPGEFKDLKGITQYYRRAVEIPPFDRFVSYEFMVTVRGGVVVYLNGETIYKYHLPSFIVSTTPPTEVFEKPTKLYGSGSLQFGSIEPGVVVFAVEIHSMKGEPETTFDASLIFNTDNKNLIVDGEPSSNIPGYVDNYIYHTVDKAFDGNVETKYVGLSDCQFHYIDWTYHYGRKEVATKLTFIRGDHELRVPDELSLLATNDNINWDYLIWKQNITFGEYNTVNGTHTYMFFNNKAYNKYRLYMGKSICREGLEVAEIELYATKIEKYCPALEDYDAQVVGERSYMNCDLFYTGYKYRECMEDLTFGPEVKNCEADYPMGIIYSKEKYVVTVLQAFTTGQPTIMAADYTLTISPALPGGLSFNNQTGIITGAVGQILEPQEYKITVVNHKGSVSTTISLSYRAPPASKGLSIAAIVIAIVIVIVLILCYLKKKTSLFNSCKKQGHYSKSLSV